MIKTIFILMIALFSTNVFASERLSLTQALDMVDASPRQSASASSVDEARGKLMEANGMFMPSATVSESFTRTNDPVQVFSAKLDQKKFSAGDFAINRLNNPASVSNWVTRVEVNQPILHSATDIYKRKSASNIVESVKHMDEFNRQSLRFKVVSLYYSAVAFRKKTESLDQSIALMRSLESSYEQASAPSSANTTNYLVAKSIRTELEAQKASTVAMEANTKRSLAAVLGLQEGTDVVLTDAIPDPQGIRGSQLFSIKEAEKKRADVLAYEYNVRSADANHKAVKWSFAPNLDGYAAYNRYTGNFKDSSGSYEAGVMLSWPIFSAPKFGQKKDAHAKKIMAEQMYRAASLEADADKRNSHERLGACISQYNLSSQAVKEATNALTLAKTRYQEGSLPLLDYSQTIQNWTLLKHRQIDSMYSVAESAALNAFNNGEL